MDFTSVFQLGEKITVDPRETFTIRDGEVIILREDMFTVKYDCGYKESFNRGQFNHINIVTNKCDYIAGRKYKSGTWKELKEREN